MSDDVIDFEKAKLSVDGPGTLSVVRRGPYCRHRHLVVDEGQRVIECDDCKAVLDPIAVLIDYARRERRFEYTKAEEQRIHERIAELKRKEQNAKRRLARAVAKLPRRPEAVT